ncbi:hypothetical protein J1614_000125 [Plenodomus biglobosus]|nr:hypothetical protein J1614_000125 [Plenodomus biglobosus]
MHSDAYTRHPSPALTLSLSSSLSPSPSPPLPPHSTPGRALPWPARRVSCTHILRIFTWPSLTAPARNTFSDSQIRASCPHPSRRALAHTTTLAAPVPVYLTNITLAVCEI